MKEIKGVNMDIDLFPADLGKVNKGKRSVLDVS